MSTSEANIIIIFTTEYFQFLAFPTQLNIVDGGKKAFVVYRIDVARGANWILCDWNDDGMRTAWFENEIKIKTEHKCKHFWKASNYGSQRKKQFDYHRKPIQKQKLKRKCWKTARNINTLRRRNPATVEQLVNTSEQAFYTMLFICSLIWLVWAA